MAGNGGAELLVVFERREGAALVGGFGDAVVLGWCADKEGEERKMVVRGEEGRREEETGLVVLVVHQTGGFNWSRVAVCGVELLVELSVVTKGERARIWSTGDGGGWTELEKAMDGSLLVGCSPTRAAALADGERGEPRRGKKREVRRLFGVIWLVVGINGVWWCNADLVKGKKRERKKRAVAVVLRPNAVGNNGGSG
ncbi:hypothetical protein HAX54_036148 [Datura stramonium]|uniref:Uncharacterized protein n=1 Tax=Datura stramonium TaxID=4076 RepID=A0ABS8VJM6_DATST|nr:hypothetical protein [Datura stramonium]